MNLNSESFTIVDIPLSELHGSTLDITQKATPRRLRMIDCHAYVHEQLLRICQFNESGATSYSTISYVWKGNGPVTSSGFPEPPPHQFCVKGAEDGDPISIPVLGYACLISLHHALPYIWLDRACIMQTNKEDKNWQIKHMFELYKNAAVCVVLPGGVERLVPMDEETVWMHRGWTLQEALVPASAVVAFAWDRGGGVLHSRITVDPLPLQVIIPGHLAIAPLTSIADACYFGDLQFISADDPKVSCKTWFAARGHAKSDIPAKLLGYKIPSLALLINAQNNANDGSYERAVWQCALVRTSSRPVDMVFSIMGLFGIMLNPGDFHPDDRVGATIALAREILRAGGDASWVGTATRMRPCMQISHFPEFPTTSVGGRAEILTADGPVDIMSLIEADEPDGPRVKGEMDRDGCLTLEREACAAISTQSGSHDMVALDGTCWCLDSNIKLADLPFPRTAVIFVGSFYDWRNNENGLDRWVIKFMLVKEHTLGRFRVMSYIEIDDAPDA